MRPFPLSADRTGQWMVSNGGGNSPLWRRDGRELFYKRLQAVMSVEVAPGPVFRPGQPKELFVLPTPPAPALGATPVYDWDVNADGSRFLQNLQGGESEDPFLITVVLNWTAGLNK